jgi:hypothetical protein
VKSGVRPAWNFSKPNALEQSVQLTAGDVAVIYVHAFAGSWPPDSSIDIYGTVALTS